MKCPGMMYVNGYDHPNILAGQGTMGLEILDQVLYSFLLYSFLAQGMLMS